MSLTITKVNLPQSKYSIKAPHSMDPIGVTIHETGNIASAMAEISYMQGNNNLVSYHFAVDDYRAIQGLPLDRNGWHSGDGANGRGNRRTIGVEHCYNWNGRTTTENDSVNNPKYQKAIDNGIELVANLFIQYPQWGEPESGKNIWQHNHHDGKNCPQRIRQERRWNEYVSRVKERYYQLKGISSDTYTVKSGDTLWGIANKNGITVDELKELNGLSSNLIKPDQVLRLKKEVKPVPKPKPKPKPTTTVAGARLVKNEDAYFLATENIKVRNAPSTSATHTGTLPKGSSINYKRVFEGNGYRWLEYVGNSGNTLYLPYRALTGNTSNWGTFHSTRPRGKTIDEMAREVIRGDHGTGHTNRRKSLGVSQSVYDQVRKRVNQLS